MNSNIDRAKYLLNNGAAIALVRGDDVFSSDRKGIAPLLEFAESNKDLSGFSAADKIVGKAAALLYCYVGISEVYANVISRSACSVLSAAGISFSYDTLADYIVNRNGDGMCPMEVAVKDIAEPSQAIHALRSALNLLLNKK